MCINLSAENAVPLIEKVNEKIDKLKGELDGEHKYIMQGAMLRSRSRYYELGEHSSKYFFSLEKRNAKGRNMTSFFNEQNQLIEEPTEILKGQSAFYKSLYTKDEKIKFEMQIPPEKMISKEEKNELEQKITLEELGLALKQSKNGKAPGLDGIPVEWLKAFYPKIKELLLEVFNYCYEVKRFHASARRGVISLIPKKGRDLRWIKHWRPIILLCTDYKLLAKIISNRVKKVLDKVIHPDQTAFLAGQNASDNIQKAIDTVHLANQCKLNALLISLDFEKAFDRVNYDSLFKAMEYFNFGKNIIEWVKILFRDFFLCTMNNGHFSQFFMPTCGLFQGNPYSCYGFIIVIECLAIMIRNNLAIKGVQIGSLVNLLTMFADDLNLFIENKESVWKEVQNTIAKFEKLSGLKVNYEKSTVYRLGSARNSISRFYSSRKMIWSDKSINILGVEIYETDHEMIQENMNPIFEKAENVLKLWKMCDLSLIGKVLVCNSLIASLFVHKMTVLPLLGNDFYKRYNNMIQNFIWESKKSKIVLKILQGTKENGGLGLMDLEAKDRALKTNWIVRIHKSEILYEISNLFLKNEVGSIIWKSNLKRNDIKGIVEDKNFWTDVWICWNDLTYKTPTSEDQVKKQSPWLNSEIRIENKPIVWKHWLEKGVKTVGDLVEERSFISTVQLNQKFNYHFPFTEYYGLVNAIPVQWKRSLKEEIGTKDKDWLSLYLANKTVVKKAYHDINTESFHHTISKRWEKSEITISNEEAKTALHSIKNITIYTKFRSFQYRFLYKALITNEHLKRYKIKSYDLCTFCQIEKESTTHLFLDCQCVKKFWTEIEGWIDISLSQIGKKNFVINKIKDNPKLVENMIVLAAKVFIYNARCKEDSLSFAKFKAWTHTICNTELEIARVKNKVPQHTSKWEKIIF